MDQPVDCHSARTWRLSLQSHVTPGSPPLPGVAVHVSSHCCPAGVVEPLRRGVPSSRRRPSRLDQFTRAVRSAEACRTMRSAPCVSGCRPPGDRAAGERGRCAGARVNWAASTGTSSARRPTWWALTLRRTCRSSPGWTGTWSASRPIGDLHGGERCLRRGCRELSFPPERGGCEEDWNHQAGGSLVSMTAALEWVACVPARGCWLTPSLNGRSYRRGNSE